MLIFYSLAGLSGMTSGFTQSLDTISKKDETKEVIDEKKIYILHAEFDSTIQKWQKVHFRLFEDIDNNDFVAARMYSLKGDERNKTVVVLLSDGSRKERVVTEVEIENYITAINRTLKTEKWVNRLMLVSAGATVGIVALIFYVGAHSPGWK